MSTSSASTQRLLIATAEDSGGRLDRFIATNCPELSRTRAQELIESGLVLIDGVPAKKGSQHLRGTEKISLEAPERPAIVAEAESIPLDVLYEDDDIIGINKPAGMVVHAGAGNPTGTLVNALLGRGQSLSQGGDALRPGIVHRLDKETSGVILVAKNDAAHAKLGEAFRQRAVKKTYIALVQGLLAEKSGSIDLPIGRDPVRRTRMAVQQKSWHGSPIANLREARTDWRVLVTLANATLVEIQLHTGRTHQIRVHFAALKHPVVGDTLYGAAERLRLGTAGAAKTSLGNATSHFRKSGEKISGKNSEKDGAVMPALSRNFLHAAKLGFAQPRTGAWIELRAALPHELRGFLHELATAAGESPQRIDGALAGYL